MPRHSMKPTGSTRRHKRSNARCAYFKSAGMTRRPRRAESRSVQLGWTNSLPTLSPNTLCCFVRWGWPKPKNWSNVQLRSSNRWKLDDPPTLPPGRSRSIKMTHDSGRPNTTSALRIPSRQISSRPSPTGWPKPAHWSDRSAPDGATMRFQSGAVFPTQPCVRSATRSWICWWRAVA
jgi:hypothetical protein